MPKRTDIKSILIIGAGPIVIGQACEFDYSGAQACKALRAEGYKIILVNSNPATIMTDPEMADRTYIEPITWEVVARIIEKERPDAILPTMGGQTALNCALDLAHHGILDKFKVELIGAKEDAIDMAEDRARFKAAMTEIGLDTPASFIAHTIQESLDALAEIGFPIIIRPSFTMGGTGGGIAYNKDEFMEIVERGLDLSPTKQLLLEESVLGWKEYEMEVVRDKKDNCIIICSIENLDPMGVHTGDSITVAPAQTLTDREYQIMRNASIKVLRKIGVETGGSNVQFAINPANGRMIVIEMNPRVSRSSALASKATGFPIAKIAAKLAVGFTLDELQNDITSGQAAPDSNVNATIIPASFEPTIDYVVTKIPRFAFEKFKTADDRLTTQMKSVGEVMAMGRTFQESLQKALRSLETGLAGFKRIIDDQPEHSTDHSVTAEMTEKLINEMGVPRADRLLYVAEALRVGMSLAEIFDITKIDPWFLEQLSDLVMQENTLRQSGISALQDADIFRDLKRMGFSDIRLAALTNTTEDHIRELRHAISLHPVYKRVDSVAGEFATATAYLYSSYEQICEAAPTNKDKIMILGGGPNRIGQGIEFDYCCVHAALCLREKGFETIMVNCNPETVSTDYDTADRLYFEPLTLEDVLEIVRIEKPKGVIVQYGGQTPLKLAKSLEKAGVQIIGTSPDAIDASEDRERFQKIIQELDLLQPPNRTARDEASALILADEIGYPIVVRPSYVLGGRAMEIVKDAEDLQRYMKEAVSVSHDSPVLLDRFLDDAIEVDIDAICDGDAVIICGIMEHIEQAGIHSGDSACSLPPFSLSDKTIKALTHQVEKMAHALKVKGLMNTQFAIQKSKTNSTEDDTIYVLEVNPRASRTVPFVSKATGIPWAKVGAFVMAGFSLKSLGFKGCKSRDITTSLFNKLTETLKSNFNEKLQETVVPPYFSVKEAVFPFVKFQGVDPVLGPEMRSTGEVMGIGESFGSAFYKSQLAASSPIPQTGTVFISVRDQDKPQALALAQSFLQLGFAIVATAGTAKFIQNAGLACKQINKAAQGRPHVIDAIKNREIALVINTTESKISVKDSLSIRRAAIMNKVAISTTLSAAFAIIEALKESDANKTSVTALQDLHARLKLSDK